MLVHVLSDDMTGWDRAKTTRDKGGYCRYRNLDNKAKSVYLIFELVIMSLVDLILYLYRQNHLD